MHPIEVDKMHHLQGGIKNVLVKIMSSWINDMRSVLRHTHFYIYFGQTIQHYIYGSKTHKRLKERFLIRRNRTNLQIFEVILFFKLRTIQQKTVKPTYLCPLDARKLDLWLDG